METDRALLLLYLEGRTHQEIGEELGISETNAGTRLNRLKIYMREQVLQSGKTNSGNRP